jgi:hypothetical protein
VLDTISALDDRAPAECRVRVAEMLIQGDSDFGGTDNGSTLVRCDPRDPDDSSAYLVVELMADGVKIGGRIVVEQGQDFRRVCPC